VGIETVDVMKLVCVVFLGRGAVTICIFQPSVLGHTKCDPQTIYKPKYLGVVDMVSVAPHGRLLIRVAKLQRQPHYPSKEPDHAVGATW